MRDLPLGADSVGLKFTRVGVYVHVCASVCATACVCVCVCARVCDKMTHLLLDVDRLQHEVDDVTGSLVAEPPLGAVPHQDIHTRARHVHRLADVRILWE